MAVSRVGSAFSNASPTSSTNPTFTLPAGISNGDFGILILCISSTSITPTLSGWAVSAALDNGSNARTFILTNTSMSSGDSGATKTITLASSRWAIAGAVYTGALAIDVNTNAQDTSLGSSFTVPAFTPAAPSEMAVCLLGSQRAFGTADGVSAAPSGFTQRAHAATNNSGASDFEATLFEQTLSSSDVSAHGSSSGAFAGSSRANTYIITLEALSAAASLTDLGFSVTQTVSVVANVPAADTGTGSDTMSTIGTAPPVDTGASVDDITTVATAALADTGFGTEGNVAVGPALADVSLGSINQQVTVVATAVPADTAAGVDDLTVVASVVVGEIGTGADLLSASTAPSTPQLDDAATAVEGLVVVKSDLIQIRRPGPGHDVATYNPHLAEGEPLMDEGGAIRVGPAGGGNAADQPRTLMAGKNSVRTLTTSGPILPTDWGVILNGASLTATLPDPTLWPGWRHWVKNTNASTATLATTAGNVDGGSTLSLAQWDKAEVVSDGTNWLTI